MKIPRDYKSNSMGFRGVENWQESHKVDGWKTGEKSSQMTRGNENGEH